MKLSNKEQAKIIMSRAGLYGWQIALKLGLRPESLSRWFRADDITAEQLDRITEVCEGGDVE